MKTKPKKKLNVLLKLGASSKKPSGGRKTSTTKTGTSRKAKSTATSKRTSKDLRLSGDDSLAKDEYYACVHKGSGEVLLSKDFSTVMATAILTTSSIRKYRITEVK